MSVIYGPTVAESWALSDVPQVWLARLPCGLLLHLRPDATVDASSPARPHTYYSSIIPRVLVYKVIRDFYHQTYETD